MVCWLSIDLFSFRPVHHLHYRALKFVLFWIVNDRAAWANPETDVVQTSPPEKQCRVYHLEVIESVELLARRGYDCQDIFLRRLPFAVLVRKFEARKSKAICAGDGYQRLKALLRVSVQFFFQFANQTVKTRDVLVRYGPFSAAVE